MRFMIQAPVLLVEDSSLKLLHRVFKNLKRSILVKRRIVMKVIVTF